MKILHSSDLKLKKGTKISVKTFKRNLTVEYIGTVISNRKKDNLKMLEISIEKINNFPGNSEKLFSYPEICIL